MDLRNNNSKEIKNLKTVWEQFKNTYSEAQKKDKNTQRNKLLEEWKGYSKKIRDSTLSLEEYTNLKKNNDYLCHFLERETTDIFGSSNVAGSANSLMVKLNEDGKTYYIHKYEKGKKKAEIHLHQSDEANLVFKQEVLTILNKILCKNSIKEKIEVAKKESEVIKGQQNGYIAKSILRKMIALEHPNECLYVYSRDKLKMLYETFQDSLEEKTNARLDEWGWFLESSKIKKLLQETFGLSLDGDYAYENTLLAEFIYKFIDSNAIADENSPNVILYGPPGTGKTHQVKQMLDFICRGDDSIYEILQFHPSFTYEDFIEGIKPQGVKNGNIEFGLVNGIFKNFCIKAKNNPDKKYYFVVDEINRANLSAVFGETLSLLESDYRHDLTAEHSPNKNLIKTQYASMVAEENAYEYIDEEAYFGVPKNIYFIGMMNDVDKSIDTFDLALRRRFKWIRMDCNYEVIRNHTHRPNGSRFDNIEAYVECAENLNKYISETLGLGKSYEFGHSFFMKLSGIAKRDIITDSNLSALFNEYLRPTLKEYLRAFESETEIEKKGGALDKALEEFKRGLTE